MKNLKISRKLFLGFGAILAMFVFSIVFAALSLNFVAQNLNDFYVRPFANVKQVLEADRESEAAAKYMLRACLEEDVSTTNQMLELAQDRLDLVSDYTDFLMTNYSGSTNDITQLKNEMLKLDSVLEEYAVLCRTNDVQGAYRVYKATVVDLLTDITNSVNTIMSQADNFATETHDDGMRSSVTTIIIMIAIGTVAVVVGILLHH